MELNSNNASPDTLHIAPLSRFAVLVQICLYMSAAGLRSYVCHTFTDKVDPAKTDGVTADDVISPLIGILSPGSFTQSKEQFFRELQSEEETGFRPCGELVHSFTAAQSSKQFEVYKCRESTPGFREYHQRLQTWIMFYIDAVSEIHLTSNLISIHLDIGQCLFLYSTM